MAVTPLPHVFLGSSPCLTCPIYLLVMHCHQGKMRRHINSNHALRTTHNPQPGCSVVFWPHQVLWQGTHCREQMIFSTTRSWSGRNEGPGSMSKILLQRGNPISAPQGRHCPTPLVGPTDASQGLPRCQKPLLGSWALCAARCKTYCVVSMKRLAQFSRQ